MFGWMFKRSKDGLEKRSSGSGFTSEIMAAREAYVSGRQGIAELTATAQSCISLWEHGFAIADVDGTELLDRQTLALAGRSVALRGEALFLIKEDRLVPCSDWDLRTRDARPTAYRVSISEAGGGRTETALAGEVIHLRIGCDPAAPYYGSAPLKRAQLTAGLLNAVESALAEIYENAPLGSMIVPFPESPETNMEALGRGFRAKRGRILMRESVSVSAAGGPQPQADWRPADVTPDLSQAMSKETLEAARNAIGMVFGVLPGLMYTAAMGPIVRESQRHLAQWQLQPIAELLAEEASQKLGRHVQIDLLRPLQAFDTGGRARALSGVIEALALAKETGVDTEQALKLVDWD